MADDRYCPNRLYYRNRVCCISSASRKKIFTEARFVRRYGLIIFVDVNANIAAELIVDPPLFCLIIVMPDIKLNQTEIYIYIQNLFSYKNHGIETYCFLRWFCSLKA